MSTTPKQSSFPEVFTGVPMPLPSGGGAVEYINAFEQEALRRSLWPRGCYPEICDEEDVVGDSTLHTRTCEILGFGLDFHFSGRPTVRVFRDLNLYYSEEKPRLFVAPDAMVVETPQPLPADLPSYTLDQDGPVPLVTAEVLSPRTFKKEDLEKKPALYKALGVQEYILIDVSGELMPERLVLMWQKDGVWIKVQDADGGVTSQLGFRLIIDADGQLRVLDAHTGKRYARPEEAQSATDALAAANEARRQAEERIKALEEELARRRGQGPQPNGPNPQG